MPHRSCLAIVARQRPIDVATDGVLNLMSEGRSWKEEGCVFQQPVKFDFYETARRQPAQTVVMPSIGLMSPTKRSKSAMVKSPGVFEGSSGFQCLPFCQRYESRSPSTR